jgi:dTDP-4-amino-4,6-dideoxygalactose transaminase
MHDFYVDLLKILKEWMFYFSNDDYCPNYWLSAVLISANASHGVSSDDLRIALQEENIESRPLWKPMHMQPIFASYPYYGNNVAESLFENGLCLPSGSNLTDSDRQNLR